MQQGGSSSAAPIRMQYYVVQHLHPGASRHPDTPDLELNRNPVGPLFPSFNRGPTFMQPSQPPFYSQMPAMQRQMDFNRNHPPPSSIFHPPQTQPSHQHNTNDLAGAPAPGALKPPECPVCMEPLQSLPSPKVVLMTPCGHLFCSVCLNEALRTKNECPTCRKSVMGVRADGARRAFL